MQGVRESVPQSLKVPAIPVYYVVLILMSPVHRCFDTYFWRLFITFLAILNRKICCKVQKGRLKWFLIISFQTKYSHYNDARSPKQCFFYFASTSFFYCCSDFSTKINICLIKNEATFFAEIKVVGFRSFMFFSFLLCSFSKMSSWKCSGSSTQPTISQIHI